MNLHVQNILATTMNNGYQSMLKTFKVLNDEKKMTRLNALCDQLKEEDLKKLKVLRRLGNLNDMLNLKNSSELSAILKTVSELLIYMHWLKEQQHERSFEQNVTIDSVILDKTSDLEFLDDIIGVEYKTHLFYLKDLINLSKKTSALSALLDK